MAKKSGLSRDANYDMDEALAEIEQMEEDLDMQVELQVILQLLVKTGLVTREQVADMRKTVKSQPKYKEQYDAIEKAKGRAYYYQQNPKEHLKDLMNAKMRGGVR